MARAAAADAGGLDPELLGDFLDRLADTGTDRGWDRHQRAGFVALGARAAEQGVLLRAVVDLYLSAAWRAWPLLPAVASDDTAAIRRAGLQVLHACDDVVAAVAEGLPRPAERWCAARSRCAGSSSTICSPGRPTPPAC